MPELEICAHVPFSVITPLGVVLVCYLCFPSSAVSRLLCSRFRDVLSSSITIPNALGLLAAFRRYRFLPHFPPLCRKHRQLYRLFIIDNLFPVRSPARIEQEGVLAKM